MKLSDIGWDAFFQEAFEARAQAGECPARVAVEHRSSWQILTGEGERTGVLAGKLRHELVSPGDWPAVGDWVIIRNDPKVDQSVIQAVLPRRTKFSRTEAGPETDEQILAANIDRAFIVASLGDDLNPRRLERYLMVAWESGAEPAILLTKSDLCPAVEERKREAEAVAAGVPVLAVCSISGQGMDALRELLPPGKTGALLGPSGVGKSTLINHWCESSSLDLPVQEVRDADQKGRHTTTRRQMILLDNGGLIIDTPGMRELQVWEGAAGFEEAFADVQDLSLQCRFANCQHGEEPGCAVQAAIVEGHLDPERLASHQKLQRELEHFEQKHNKRLQAEARRRHKGQHKNLRTILKRKGRT